MDDIVAVFKEKKLKLTPQRLAVYNYLKGVTTHPNAEVIYNALHDDYPTMSLATVYKALKTLSKANLIQELNVGEGNFRYDGNSKMHPHIQCIKCGKVDDLDIDLSFVNEHVKPNTTYDVLYSKVYFYGICDKCKNS